MATLYAFEWFILFVCYSSVFTHGGASDETSPTNIAGVRSFPGMSPHVFFDMTFPFVSLSANIATIRSLS